MDSYAAKRLIILKGFSHSSVSSIKDIKELEKFLLIQDIKLDLSKAFQVIEISSNSNERYVQVLRFVEDYSVFEVKCFEMV